MVPTYVKGILCWYGVSGIISVGINDGSSLNEHDCKIYWLIHDILLIYQYYICSYFKKGGPSKIINSNYKIPNFEIQHTFLHINKNYWGKDCTITNVLLFKTSLLLSHVTSIGGHKVNPWCISVIRFRVLDFVTLILDFWRTTFLLQLHTYVCIWLYTSSLD